jgi:hypothetical protein
MELELGEPYDDRERDSEIVHERPVALELLLVAQLCEPAFIRRLGPRHASLRSIRVVGHSGGALSSENRSGACVLALAPPRATAVKVAEVEISTKLSSFSSSLWKILSNSSLLETKLHSSK